MAVRRLPIHAHRENLNAEPIPNWCTLSRADHVEIYKHGKAIAAGRIDMLALDGSVLWLRKDAGNDRALFLHSDGLRVYRRSPTTKRRAPA
jgi:hypothetical protein